MQLPCLPRYVALIAIPLMQTTEAHAQQCDPRDFIVQDTVSYVMSAETELAFVLTANEEQFNKAKSNGGISGAYGLISGSANFATAKERAQRIARSIQFDSSSSYASNYLQQTTSEVWAEAYVRCLGANSPGMHLWLDSKNGDFLTFRGFWVGADTTVGTASLDREPIVSGGFLIDVPQQWVKGQQKEAVVRRDGNQDVYLGLHVGGESGSAVVVRDPPKWTWVSIPVVSDVKMSVITSYSNPCTAGEQRECISPSNGGLFRVETAAITERKTSFPQGYSEVFDTKTPFQICAKITQTTGACEFRQTAEGRLMAIEEVPRAVDAGPAPGQAQPAQVIVLEPRSN